MKRLLTATAMLLATAAMAQAEGELQLYNWGDYTSPELLESLSQSMAEGGASATPGAAPTPLSGHGSHRLEPAAAARQDAQNADANARKG